MTGLFIGALCCSCFGVMSSFAGRYFESELFASISWVFIGLSGVLTIIGWVIYFLRKRSGKLTKTVSFEIDNDIYCLCVLLADKNGMSLDTVLKHLIIGGLNDFKRFCDDFADGEDYE